MTVENINPLYFLSPLIPIIIGFSLIFYWKAKRSFRWIMLFYALPAYAGAIIIKAVFQAFTISYILDNFGKVSVVTGLYYGLQTSFLEVGLAYAVARYALGRKKMVESDAEAYGLSLSFWENVVLLGAISLFSLVVTYLTIAYGSPGIASTVREALLNSSPSLFSGTFPALKAVGLSVLERTSSLLAHFSWGFLVVVSVSRRKLVYFLAALPMGLIDALVPYAYTIGIVRFEFILFGITAIFLLIAIVVKKKEKVDYRSDRNESSTQT